MPDGDHVIGVAAAAVLRNESMPRTPQIDIVLNWFEEVRQKSR